MVVREAQRVAANNAALTLGQGAPFEAPIATPANPTVIAGRWCSWPMNQGERDNLLAAFRTAGFSARESTIIDASRSPKLTDRLFIFDGDFYGTEEVLSLVGFEPYAAPE